jgi:hypothetical protein
MQAKFDYGGSILSLSLFLLLPWQPLNARLAKGVKIDSKIIISQTVGEVLNWDTSCGAEKYEIWYFLIVKCSKGCHKIVP